ncbi:MAG: hyi, partial [Microbacterium sp.]|nr:hyi [Microbacterium sp.]
MYVLAPNIELLFAEAGDYHDRVRAAAADGFTAVEMWGPTGVDAPATPKDLPALKAALEETGVQLTAQLAEPRTQFMIPPWDHSEFFRKLDEGVEIAHRLGTPRMVVGSGTGFGGWKRQVQLDKLVEIYRKAIAQIDGSGVTLVLEPVNVRVDHPGSLLDRTAEAVYVARGVDSPA